MNPATWKALAYMEAGDLGRARSLVIPKLEEDPEDPDNWLALGVIQAHNRDYDWAAQSLEKFLHCLEKKFKGT